MTESNVPLAPPKPLGKLFKWLRVFFIAYIVSEAVYAVGCALSLSTGSIMFGPDQPFSVSDGIEAVGGIFLVIFYIVCIVFFCIFSYRAVKNLHLLGVENVEISPGWAVGWYFIPIANLWKPYGAMSEMWTGSHGTDAPDWETPKTMPIWWICWIVTNIANNAPTRMGMRAGLFEDYASDVPLYKTTLYIDIFSAVTGIVVAWLILGILQVIADKQDLRMQAVAFD